MAKKKILVIDEDIRSTITIKFLLETEGYSVIFAYDKITGIEKARLEKPDLILLDADAPGIDGLTVSTKLKEDSVTKFIPVIALVDLVDTLTGMVRTINTEAYLLKPFNSDELKIEIERLLRKTVEQLSANPLTRLPGSISIEENVAMRIKNKEKYAVCYLDFDNFKPYNDYYGFERGDQVIKLLAQILIDVSRLKGNRNDFIGHIGGDDFVFVTTPDKIDDMCVYITETFDREILKFYDEKDIEKGYITTKDRRFQIHNFPIMTISIGVATNELREYEHYGKIVDVLVEMKKYVKSLRDQKGSKFMKDRRKDPQQMLVPPTKPSASSSNA